MKLWTGLKESQRRTGSTISTGRRSWKNTNGNIRYGTLIANINIEVTIMNGTNTGIEILTKIERSSGIVAIKNRNISVIINPTETGTDQESITKISQHLTFLKIVRNVIPKISLKKRKTVFPKRKKMQRRRKNYLTGIHL